MTKNYTIGFIGGGNMARSLIGGLQSKGIEPQRLWVSDPNDAQLSAIRQGFAVHTSHDNLETVKQADVLILAVKPQIMKAVTTALAAAIQARKPLIISIAAGIRLSSLEQWLGPQSAIVRTMPNTPALVLSGATAMVANNHVHHEQRNIAESIMRAVGTALWVDDEDLMDAVTALSGSGPAYFFLVMEAMEKAGQQLGLSAETARLLTLQTAFGAAKMALESPEDPAQLRQRVTSPGGTTEQALQVLQQAQLETVFAQALAAAARRSQELAELFGEQ